MFKKAKITCQGGEVLSLAVVNTAAPSAKEELENMASAAKSCLLPGKKRDFSTEQTGAENTEPGDPHPPPPLLCLCQSLHAAALTTDTGFTHGRRRTINNKLTGRKVHELKTITHTHTRRSHDRVRRLLKVCWPTMKLQTTASLVRPRVKPFPLRTNSKVSGK